jgi:hypothetical protein
MVRHCFCLFLYSLLRRFLSGFVLEFGINYIPEAPVRARVNLLVVGVGVGVGGAPTNSRISQCDYCYEIRNNTMTTVSSLHMTP